MDLRLFIAVIARSKRTVLAGLAAAVVLAAATYGQPTLSGGMPTLKPRGAEVWQAQAQLLISSESFPYGRAVEQYQATGKNAPASPIGDTTFMANLAPIYAALANGNAVQARIAQLKIPGTVKAADMADTNTGLGLPLVNLTATAPTAASATQLANRSATTLQTYVSSEQAAAGTETADRVELTILQSGADPTLVQGHKLSVPILVFMAVLIGTLAMVFLRENFKSRPAGTLGRVSTTAAMAHDNGHAGGHGSAVVADFWNEAAPTGRAGRHGDRAKADAASNTTAD